MAKNKTSSWPIGEEQIKKAMQTLLTYKNEKQGLENRLRENELMWRMAHWMLAPGRDNKNNEKRIKPKSAWLVNTILNKHADAMDNFPEANILPRSKDDEKVAKILSQIMPVILEQAGFNKAYSRLQWYKPKNGTGVYGCFWDKEMDNGIGNISIKKESLGNLYWKSNVEDLQDSPNLFHVKVEDNETLKAKYPNIELDNRDQWKFTAADLYKDDNNVDMSEQTVVIDWYYKKRKKIIDKAGVTKVITVLHLCTFCNGQVLFATENDDAYKDNGLYDHGKYPFIFDVLFPVENSCTGFGYIDMIKDDQLFIDKMQQAFLENTAWNSKPRHAVRSDSGLNEEEFLDTANDLVHFDGDLGENAFRPIPANPLPPISMQVYLEKIQEMKDTSGNTASSQGQNSNVTSASGIASLQEASGKLSRDANQASYEAFKDLVYMVIELIRQFYDVPRIYRITDEIGHSDYVTFDNTGIKPIPQDPINGMELADRVPILDIEVKPQKRNAYSKETQNQTAINLYNLGFFAPNNADASLACLDMMEFDGIEKVRENVANNKTLYDMVIELQAQMQMLVGAMGGNPAAVGQPIPQTEPSAPRRGVQDSKGSLSSQAAAATRGSASPQ